MDISNASTELRGMIGEATASHWSARTLLDCLNRAQLRIGMELSQTIGDWLLTKENITITNGIGTLPFQCAKPAFLFNTTNNVIVPISMNPREQGRMVLPSSYEHLQMSSYEAYLYGNYIKINANLTGTYELWYEKRIVSLLYGTVFGGGVGYITLPNDPLPRSLVDDYYNGVNVIIFSGTGAVAKVTATDYVANSGVLNIAGTYDVDTAFTMESPLPEEAYDYWIAQAAMIAFSKPASVVDKEAITWIKDDLTKAKNVFNDWCSTRVKDNTYMMRK